MTMKTAERNVVLSVRCNLCGKTYALYVTKESFEEFTSPNRRHIQDIFPYLSAEEMELLISNTCPKCWEDMFGGDEDLEWYEPTPEDLKEWQDASCGLC